MSCQDVGSNVAGTLGHTMQSTWVLASVYIELTAQMKLKMNQERIAKHFSIFG